MGWLRRRLHIRGRRRKLIAAGLVLMPVLGVVSVEVTSQPWFCNSCHIMEPYYASWKTSSHRNVDCVKCHIAPGVDSFIDAKLNGLGQVVDDVLHRTSTKPSASVSQLSCTRSGCHDIETVRATSKTSGAFKFKHEPHLGLELAGIKLECGTCHSHIKGDEHFELNREVCINCHLLEGVDPGPPVPGADGKPLPQRMIRLAVRAGQTTLAADAPPAPALSPGEPAGHKHPPNACTACHDPPAGILERNGAKIDHAQFLAYGAACESCHQNATAAPEPISDGRCLACHTFGIERNLGAEKMHRVHLEGRHKIECFSCHGPLQHGLSAQAASFEHFDCRACHQDQHEAQRGSYVYAAAHGAGGAVSPMFMAHVDCNGCHTAPRPVSTKPDSGATVAAATAAACDACHSAGLGERMIPLWQKTTRSLYDRLEADLNSAQAEPNADADTLESTRKLLRLIRVDGSWGVHNPRYTQQLLEQARDKLAAARGKPAGEGGEGGTP